MFEQLPDVVRHDRNFLTRAIPLPKLVKDPTIAMVVKN
jgi:hypothetical protein